ncbi:hypothetical protein BXY85_2335 [Roseivirga pacifica]|uniref:Nucleotidyltransferase domain-containing protein n=1 Tax=Roseivirga pacifica TaxID=1267423 RepID=A0A1I0NME9_9BACT|nr:hypothetical protein [Roseivirga pacifica]RKQ51312.1 hypothetical protein BXY85_2335 [Roseivirga pacifica]SEW02564.1 hypothetical protein SAMN05216290_1317 [Roseivirga pacifica]
MDISLSNVELAIIRTLAYYQLFKHPLLESEISRNLGVSIDEKASIREQLKLLKQRGAILEINEHYLLEGDVTNVLRRKEGETRAKKMFNVAKRYSSLIYLFPFVRGVFISGSLSKGSISEDADIDYFIVTKTNRLWITRTMLVAFKRIFLLGSKRHFCVNYFVDEDNLIIPDQNVFTATEISTLIPMHGNSVCHNFLNANAWIKDVFPNMETKQFTLKKDNLLKRFSKNIVESFFLSVISEPLDKFFMKKTYQRWTSLYSSSLSKDDFEVAFRTHRGTSKNHDKNYQKRVLETIDANFNQALIKIGQNSNA